jgi:glycosyltransferase involved in cell wall biosynthesis
MEKCHHIVVPSNSFKEILGEGFGLNERVTVIPTGIQLAPYQQADGDLIRAKHGWGSEKILVSVGRLAPEKNWETLLHAAARVMSEVSEFRVLLIGDGPSKKDLVKLAKKLGIGERVTFLGQIPFEEVPGYLKAADLFGFASVTETQGLVTMEALAAGLPVAAVDAPGTRDGVTHGKEALLTKNDSAELAEAIRTLVLDEDLYAQYKKAAIEKANSFEIKNVSKRLVDVYRQAMEDQRRDRRVQLEKTHKLFKIDWKRLPSLS